MTKAEKAEVINFFSGWLDHKVAAIEEEIKQLELQIRERASFFDLESKIQVSYLPKSDSNIHANLNI